MAWDDRKGGYAIADWSQSYTRSQQATTRPPSPVSGGRGLEARAGNDEFGDALEQALDLPARLAHRADALCEHLVGAGGEEEGEVAEEPRLDGAHSRAVDGVIDIPAPRRVSANHNRGAAVGAHALVELEVHRAAAAVHAAPQARAVDVCLDRAGIGKRDRGRHLLTHAELDTQRIEEALERKLGGGVAGPGGRRHEAHHAAHHQQPDSALRLPHGTEAGVEHADTAHVVDVHQVLHDAHRLLALAQRGERRAHGEPGIENEQVDGVVSNGAADRIPAALA
mmetsp:Transcript_2408/g.7510  ORF Transcript_2408/g.7510 Transcript_2408/m.7510 type:complete len:281 (+) Transcript_2408:104-946(+)